MKKLLLSLLVIIYTLPVSAQIQNGMLTRIMGGGPNPWYLDNVPAQSCSDYAYINGMDVDSSGNLYYLRSEGGWELVVMKINANNGYVKVAMYGLPEMLYSNDMYIDNANNIYTSLTCNNVITQAANVGLNTSMVNMNVVAGSITSYAADQTCLYKPFEGDGGLATNAKLWEPFSMKKDVAGNLYISDNGHQRIRKVNAQTGIINTIAGGGSSTADGVPATSAQLRLGIGFCIDKHNNIYIVDSAKIRKIDGQSGIITTVAGTGTYGYSGDNGSALNAQIAPGDIDVDSSGNLYFTEPANKCIRKIDAGTQIIHTIAGGGNIEMGYNSPMEMPATAAKFRYLNYMCIDRKGDIYFSAIIDTITQGSYIYKLSFHTPVAAASDSLAVYVYDSCSGSTSTIISQHYSTGDSIKTYFGDGSTETHAMISLNGQGYVNVVHAYAFPGSYRVKDVLYNGGIIKDSVSYNYVHQMCSTIPLEFFYDANGNCAFDTSTDANNTFPALVAVDSNSVPIDTISVTSMMYYNVRGNNNDVYTFRPINNPGNLQLVCPASGVRNDTLKQSLTYHPPLTFGFSCPVPSNNYDLSVVSVAQTGRHLQNGTIMVNNSYCNSQNGLLTMHFSPKYEYCDAIPTPTSISGQTLVWNLNGISPALEQTMIHYSICKTTTDVSTWLAPGDTVHTDITLSPTTSDVNVANNHCIRTDTVKSSYDPNEMSVQPSGVVPEEVTLVYTIEFENTGNDTAHNIYVLDTLSANVNMKSLRIISSDHKMNISSYHDSLHIVKFDFPDINLLDSSHHNQCKGIFQFSIKAKAGLPNATDISNRAGIYFDDNPVVMTNEVHNLVCSSIQVPQAMISVSPSNSICSGDTILFTAILNNQGNSPSYKWILNGNVSGTNNSYRYTPTNNDSVWLTMGSSATCALPQTVSSNIQHMNVIPTQTPTITMNGPDSLCIGMTATYTSATNISGSSYMWKVNGIVTGADSNIYTYTPVDSDVIHCSMTSPAGICVSTDTLSAFPIVVHVQSYIKTAVTIAGQVIVSQSDTVAYTAWSNIQDADYAWIVSGVNTGYHGATYKCLPSTAATISCMMYVPNNGGCYTQDSVISNTLNIDVLSEPVRIFPNPVSNTITIEAIQGAYTEYAILNSMGMTVYSGATGNNKTILNVEGLERGVYYIKLTGKHDTKVLKMVKE
jgi:sugar lactone lactonase YvrE